MNLKKAIGREKRFKECEVNIISVMNLFLLIIPFLLLTVTFVKLAVIDLSLPSLSKEGLNQTEEPPQKQLVLLILSIRETGFQLKGLATISLVFDPIDRINNQYNYSRLIEQLKQVKQQYPYAEDIILSPESKVKYDIIIKVMDRCRETGFPNVSLSG